MAQQPRRATSALLEDAAERSRMSARARAARLTMAGRPIVQIAVAAMLAWLAATELLDHPRAFFAPIAAVVTLGVTYDQRGRRAVELAVGVALGILVADLLVLALGTGTLQLGLIVALAVSAAVLLGTGALIVNQAAISAVLVVTIQPPQGTFSFDRFVDASVGTAIALAVNALLLPADPIALVRRAAAPVLAELAATLEDVARGLRDRDRPGVEAALQRARAIEALEAGLNAAVDVGRETARLAPPRRGARGQVDRYGMAGAQIDLAIRNVRVLARGAVRAVRFGDNVPPEISGALEDLAAAVRGLEQVLEGAPDGARGAVRDPALRAAATATRVLESTGNLSVSVIVGQLRATAVDLLRSAGLEDEAAIAAVRQAASAALADPDDDPAGDR
ncbi:MAG TPA: FUSC family protein [Solirubrobacteraceae bacterium]